MFSARPEPALIRARASGERVVAIIRLVVAFLIGSVASALNPRALVIGLSVLVVLYAAGIVWLSFRKNLPTLPWLTTALDASLITGALSVYLVYDQPVSFLINRLYFEAYFFVLATSVLRFDWRLVAFALGVILVQFLGLTGYVATHWDLAALPPWPVSFVPSYFILRVLLLAATGMTTVLVATWALHLRLLIGTDQLTGLPQRRPFLERIDEELQRARTGNGTLSLALLDVDDFKRFNDRHGHVAGDGALRALAEALQKAVRTTDLLSRYGGEEFLVAFPRVGIPQAVRRAEQIRLRLAETPLQGRGEPALLTVSIGVASWPEDGPTYEAVYAKADERLYQAKAQGKNQVVGPPEVGRVVHLREP